MLYTRKGDSGTTKTLNSSERISKSSALPEALGTLDELNSYLGLARADIRERGSVRIPVTKKGVTLEDVVREVQENLFIIQAEVAGADKHITPRKVQSLERVTDTLETLFPKLTGFSIPGGTYLSALFDVARTLARRAERRVVGVHESGIRDVSSPTLAYLNRLSSLLFALARYANHMDGVAETTPTYR